MPSVILLKAPDRSIITGIRTSTMKHASLLLTSSLLLCGFGNMAEAMAQFIILRQDYSYYGTLRNKLSWAGTRINYVNNHRN